MSAWFERIASLKKAILLLDNALSHPDIASLSSDDGQITCLFLPPNTASLIQPMDQGVLQSIKLTYKRDVLLRMLDGGDEINVAEFAKQINIRMLFYSQQSVGMT